MSRTKKVFLALTFATAIAAGAATPALADGYPDGTTHTTNDGYPDSSTPVAPNSLQGDAANR